MIPCGGGKSVICADMAKRTTERGKRVLFLVHRQELCQQIQETFRQYGVDMRLCQVGMVQTVTRQLDCVPRPDLIITDENHHCVKELIAKNCLAPFDYYAPPVADLSGIHSRAGEFIAEEVAAALDKPHIYGDIIRHYRQLADGRKAICYCPSIRYSEAVAEQFQAAGITAVHIDGATPQTERQRMVQAFRTGDIQILCNVDLISEGFDVPDCGASVLLRPTKSLTLYIQQAMRCMRYQRGKRAVIIDHVGNVHRFGLPDQDREWALDPKPPKKKQLLGVRVKQCPKCFFTHEPALVCPACGHVYEAERKPLKEVKEARLKKITERVVNYRSPEECNSVSELVAYGKKMGYKPGWSYYQAKQRGFLR